MSINVVDKFTKYGITGHVSHGYEPVIYALRKQQKLGYDRRSQLCIWVGNDCVVDVVMDTIGNDAFDINSLTTVFSSGKSFAAIMLAMMVDQGRLRYDDHVVKHWPEFGQNGKSVLTVADVMRHESGMSRLSEQMLPEDAFTENLKANKVGSVIERETMDFMKDTTDPRLYHTLTRDLISNEIFRRVEEKGRTMGEYLREELQKPHKFDMIIGMKDSEFSRRIPYIRPSNFQLAMLMWAGPDKAPTSFNYTIYKQDQEDFKKSFKEKIEQKWPKFKARMSSEFKPKFKSSGDLIAAADRFYQSSECCKMECPSSNMQSNGRSMGRCAAYMANRGKLEDKQLMSEKTWEEMHKGLKKGSLGGMMKVSHFSQGGLNLFKKDPNTKYQRDGFFGWMGFGGSVMQWHPELKIGFGYCPFDQNPLDFYNQRACKLQEVVVQIVRGNYKKKEKKAWYQVKYARM